MKPTPTRRRATATGSITAAYRPDGQHELICRKAAAGGPENILLDGDARAEGKEFFSLGDALHSPDHRRLAFACDERGNELHRIYWRDLASGADGADVVENSDGAIVWTETRPAFSIREWTTTSVPRKFSCIASAPIPSTDRLVFAEKDPAWFVHLRAARSRNNADRQGQRSRLLGMLAGRSQLAGGAGAPRVAAPRRAAL